MNETLEAAQAAIDRAEDQYGEAEDSFETIAHFWQNYLWELGFKNCLDPHDVANMMILMKVARNATGVYHQDNWADIAGYAAHGDRLQGQDGYK